MKLLLFDSGEGIEERQMLFDYILNHRLTAGLIQIRIYFQHHLHIIAWMKDVLINTCASILLTIIFIPI